MATGKRCPIGLGLSSILAHIIIIIVESSRVEAPMAYAPRRSFCTILQLSTLSSHISNAISRVVCESTCVPDQPHFTNTPPTPSTLPALPQRTTTRLLPATSLPTLPVVDLLPGIHIHTPRNISGWLTVDHHPHRHIDLIRFSDQTFSLSNSRSKPATNLKHTIITATC